MAIYKIKRIYDQPNPEDGCRVLVDRLWPRGVSKQQAAVDTWLKQAGPSDDLRKWFGHRPERFDEFKRRYQTELKSNPAVNEIGELAKRHPVVTLLYSAHDQDHNQAVVLKEYLER